MIHPGDLVTDAKYFLILVQGERGSRFTVEDHFPPVIDPLTEDAYIIAWSRDRHEIERAMLDFVRRIGLAK